MIKPGETPPASLEASLQAKGASARQMAASASGRFLVTLGPGKVKSGLASAVGGRPDQRARREAQPVCGAGSLHAARLRRDPGRPRGRPRHGRSHPHAGREGHGRRGRQDRPAHRGADGSTSAPGRARAVGISAGMFTTPFIELEGTWRACVLGMGAKGATAGVAAAATGGVTVLAQGALDRYARREGHLQAGAHRGRRGPK